MFSTPFTWISRSFLSPQTGWRIDQHTLRMCCRRPSSEQGVACCYGTTLHQIFGSCKGPEGRLATDRCGLCCGRVTGYRSICSSTAMLTHVALTVKKQRSVSVRGRMKHQRVTQGCVMVVLCHQCQATPEFFSEVQTLPV